MLDLGEVLYSFSDSFLFLFIFSSLQVFLTQRCWDWWEAGMIGFWRGRQELFLVQHVERLDWADWVRDLLLGLLHWWHLPPSKGLGKCGSGSWRRHLCHYFRGWLVLDVNLPWYIDSQNRWWKSPTSKSYLCSVSKFMGTSADYVSVLIVFELSVSTLLCACFLRKVFTALWHSRGNIPGLWEVQPSSLTPFWA